LHLLVLADTSASFYKLQKNTDTLPDAAPFFLQNDDSLPTYSLARIARFAPLKGQQCAVVSSIGLHFVDMIDKKETLLLVQLDLLALEYSPCDSYVICCEKWNS